MANKNLFRTLIGALLPKTNTLNREGAPAYEYSPQHKLAQYAATGCFGQTFYASADEQLETVLQLCNEVRPEFIAKTALYTRQRGHMKDMPALLCAVLAVKAPGLLAEVFERVIDNGKMLRNFVQIVRSGVTGRKSFGTAPKRLIQRWLEKRSDEALFKASVGAEPSLADVIKMAHPKPATPARAALYAYLIGKPYDTELLPALVRAFEAFKRDSNGLVPSVPFEMLTALPLPEDAWKEIARHAPWHMTRMNLNTFLRHGVFNDRELSKLIAQRLRDPDAVRKAKVFPYQLMAAYANAHPDVPQSARLALQDAMEVALENVPKLDGQVFICPDVSSSMRSPVTGARKGATSSVRCVDVAALIATALQRKNPDAVVLPFDDKVVPLNLNVRDSVMTNSAELAKIGGGGTNCSAPMARLNADKRKGELVVYVSDNQSWVDAKSGRGTELMAQWEIFKRRNPKAKLVCIDLQPYGSTQAAEREDVLNIGGFSDQVFEVLAQFHAGQLSGAHWIGVIEQVAL